MAPNPQLQGHSFRWAFLLFIALFVTSLLLVNLGRPWGIALLVVAGFVPFFVQVSTGYALDNLWVARFSRTEHPLRFWMMLAFSLAFAAWFSFVAYSVYVDASEAPLDGR